MGILREELRARLPPAMAENAIEAVAHFIFWRSDAVLGHLEAVYRQERDAWQRSSVAARRQLLADILAGQPVDIDDASARLAYDLRRHHLGVIVWSDATPATAQAGELEGAARALAAALGTDAPLIDALGGLAIAAWFGCWEPIRQDAIDAIGESMGPGLRCAVGTSGPRLEGFRATYAEALHARKAATVLRVPDAAVQYPAVSLAALLAENVEYARTFVIEELGPLLEGDRPEALARIRETVETYLELASVAETARQLGIHGNTVQHRLQRAAELLDRPLRERTLELHVALRLSRLLPAS
jgi:DNA-binding PucR family transcriptional regulator